MRISRNGLEDPLLDAAQVVTLDRIEVPEQDNLPPLRELVAKALANRPDIALAKINDETSEISALGTANGVLPSLQGFAAISAQRTLRHSHATQFRLDGRAILRGWTGQRAGPGVSRQFPKPQRGRSCFRAIYRITWRKATMASINCNCGRAT